MHVLTCELSVPLSEPCRGTLWRSGYEKGATRKRDQIHLASSLRLGVYKLSSTFALLYATLKRPFSTPTQQETVQDLRRSRGYSTHAGAEGKICKVVLLFGRFARSATYAQVSRRCCRHPLLRKRLCDDGVHWSIERFVILKQRWLSFPRSLS